MMLEVAQVSKRYMRNKDPFFAIKDADMSLEMGDFACITGRSGSGKSTFLNILAGLTRPDGGSVSLEDSEYALLDDRQLSFLRNQCIGYIPQGAGILFNHSVLDNIRLPLALNPNYRASRRKATSRFSDAKGMEKARGLMDYLGIAHLEQESPRHLSGGELRRVAIARSLVADPVIVIADEPTGDLDPETTELVMTLFARINKAGTTILLSTHESENIRFGNRRFVIDCGELVEVATESTEPIEPTRDSCAR